MIEFQEVTLKRGPLTLLDAFSFRLADPGVFVFLGGNGSGKSLFSDLLSGKCKPKAGKVRLEGSSLNGIGTDRYFEPIFHARAVQPFNYDETVLDYISSEMQLAGGDLSHVEQCMVALDGDVPGVAELKLNELPHGQVLLAQVALAAFAPCRLVVLDGHLTFLDNRHCTIAANLACDSPFSDEKYFIFTSGRLGQRLPGITQYYLLDRNLPLQINPLSSSQAENSQTRSGLLAVYFSGEWDAAKGVVSGNHFKLMSKINNGLRIKLTGSFDGMLKEFAEASLVPSRIEWE